jgi:sporulation protein YlmC with PRC-barrel domain
MLVPFGTHVVDREGKSVGTVSRLILHPQSEHVKGRPLDH